MFIGSPKRIVLSKKQNQRENHQNKLYLNKKKSKHKGFETCLQFVQILKYLNEMSSTIDHA